MAKGIAEQNRSTLPDTWVEHDDGTIRPAQDRTPAPVPKIVLTPSVSYGELGTFVRALSPVEVYRLSQQKRFRFRTESAPVPPSLGEPEAITVYAGGVAVWYRDSRTLCVKDQAIANSLRVEVPRA